MQQLQSNLQVVKAISPTLMGNISVLEYTGTLVKLPRVTTAQMCTRLLNFLGGWYKWLAQTDRELARLGNIYPVFFDKGGFPLKGVF